MILAEAFGLTARLLGIAVLVSTVELLWLTWRGEFGATGVWPWRVISVAGPPRWTGADVIFRYTAAVPVLLLLRIIAASALLWLPWGEAAVVAALGVVVLSQLMLNMRIMWGEDGADQMLTIVSVATLIAALGSSQDRLLFLCALFIVVQLSLSYFVAGVAKLFGASWRNGTALTAILGHFAYGNRHMHRWLTHHRSIASFSSHGVIAFEVLFPLQFLLPAGLGWAFIGAGLLLHLSIALVMRLNGFFYAFAAAYPALFAVQRLRAEGWSVQVTELVLGIR